MKTSFNENPLEGINLTSNDFNNIKLMIIVNKQAQIINLTMACRTQVLQDSKTEINKVCTRCSDSLHFLSSLISLISVPFKSQRICNWEKVRVMLEGLFSLYIICQLKRSSCERRMILQHQIMCLKKRILYLCRSVISRIFGRISFSFLPSFSFRWISRNAFTKTFLSQTRTRDSRHFITFSYIRMILTANSTINVCFFYGTLQSKTPNFTIRNIFQHRRKSYTQNVS